MRLPSEKSLGRDVKNHDLVILSRKILRLPIRIAVLSLEMKSYLTHRSSIKTSCTLQSRCHWRTLIIVFEIVYFRKCDIIVFEYQMAI